MVSVAVKFRGLMVFVDGTNLLRGIGRNIGLNDLKAFKPSKEILTLAKSYINTAIMGVSKVDFMRTYWFASYKGSDEDKFNLCEEIRNINCEPLLYPLRNKREKGVDIALTMSMLTNAFNHNYEIGLLIAGDEDYLELVNEVKRYGIIICGSYFKEGLSNRLKLSFDGFQYISHSLEKQRYNELVEIIKNTAKK